MSADILVLQDTFDDVLEALGAHARRDARGGRHAGARVDLDEPGHEVLGEHEVGAEQLEAVAAPVHVLLGGQQAADDALPHAGVDDRVPEVGASHGPAPGHHTKYTDKITFFFSNIDN